MDENTSYPISNVKWPKQKLSLAAKNTSWRKQHLDWADKNTKLYNRSVRKAYFQKKINIDLYAGKVYLSEIKRYLNPYEKQNVYIPNQIAHYPLVNNVIDVLIGEEANRKTRINARVINQEAISSIETKKTEIAKQLLLEFIQKEFPDEQQAQQEAERLQGYLNYSISDLEELDDNWILQHYMKEVDFDNKLIKGYKNKLILGESIYYFDVYNNEPSMEVLRPEMVTCYRTSGSTQIEDSDIIIIDDYWSPGKIHDTFYEELTPTDVKYIEHVSQTFEGGGSAQWIDATNNDKFLTIDELNQGGQIIPQDTIDGVLGFAYNEGLAQGNYVDADGNIRVLRVNWRSKKKVLKVKSYDPETGEEVYNYRTEDYKIRKELGEEAVELWPGEWWEGTKIGKEVYLRMRPKPTQGRLNNISKGFSGFVGTVMSDNRRQPYSLMDKMKQYNYLYDVTMDKLLKFMSNNVGKAAKIDLARIPAKWEPEQWMTILRNENLAFEDSFREGNVGQATGKLAGNMSGVSSGIDLDLSASIQLCIEILSWITNTMSSMVGITPQRLGEVSNRETVGGVERAVTQSSHITAELFASQDSDRIRCAEALLECCKLALRGQNKKIQVVTNDGIHRIVEINGDDIYAKDHGIFIENELDQNGLRQELKQYALAWAQNETVMPNTILKILSSPSLIDIQRKIENDIAAKNMRDQQAQQQAQQSQEAIAQQQSQMMERANQIAELKLEFDQFIAKYKIDQDNNTKLQVALIGKEGDYTEEDSLDFEKIQLQKDKVNKDYEVKKQQLKETERHNMATETIQRTKTTSKK